MDYHSIHRLTRGPGGGGTAAAQRGGQGGGAVQAHGDGERRGRRGVCLDQGARVIQRGRNISIVNIYCSQYIVNSQYL